MTPASTAVASRQAPQAAKMRSRWAVQTCPSRPLSNFLMTTIVWLSCVCGPLEGSLSETTVSDCIPRTPFSSGHTNQPPGSLLETDFQETPSLMYDIGRAVDVVGIVVVDGAVVVVGGSVVVVGGSVVVVGGRVVSFMVVVSFVVVDSFVVVEVVFSVAVVILILFLKQKKLYLVLHQSALSSDHIAQSPSKQSYPGGQSSYSPKPQKRHLW
mmetsp:Transcript_29232/g.74332  ORF Transcript_29232/g.74332 Transcript_29232/m.74332 type:complete len:212 (-) Transcript_29232:1913-2548(-)